MAASLGTRLPAKRNLLFALDSKNIKSHHDDTNILADWLNLWDVGTGSSTGFNVNGDGNSRVLDTNPFGQTSIIWDVSDQDASSDADGGWNSSTKNIDSSKTYRYSVWVRRKTNGNGSFYLGLYGYDATTNIGVVYRSTGATQTNSYFRSSSWWGAPSQWYLVVGHCWAAGTGTGAAHPDSGIYDTTGNKIGACNDFTWKAENTRTIHRSYLYYSTNTATNQQWFQPRIEIVPTPGNQSEISTNTAPSVQTLIRGGIGGNWHLMKKPTDSEAVVNMNRVRRADAGYGFKFIASDDTSSISIPLAGNFSKLVGTISVWLYPTTYSGSNGIFINRDDSTQNAVDWMWIGVWNSGGTLYFRLGDGVAANNNDLTITASNHIPLNQWTNLTCTWASGGYSYIYINGTQVASRAISTIPNTNPTTNGRIGLGYVNGDTGSWSGYMDNFMIYDTQLLAYQVMDNFKALRSRYGF